MQKVVFQEDDAGPYYMTPINQELHCYGEVKRKTIQKAIKKRLLR
jgi:hypothetical protein